MPIYRNPDRDPATVVFMHIPKTGGSSVEEGLRGAGYKQSLFSGAAFTEPPQHYPAAEIRPHLAGGYDIAFTVVRHPIDRLRSEYDWQQSPLHPLRHHAVQQVLHTDDFDTWVNFVLDRYDADPNYYGYHLRPQVDYLLAGCHVIRHERDNLRGDIARLGIIIAPLARRHAATDRSAPAMSRRTLSRVLDTYRDDFTTFGYQP